MFLNSQMMGTDIGFPDVCLTPAAPAPIPVPYPNLAMGPKIDAFEAAIAKFAGAKHAIAVNSGTAGLHLCVRAAGIAAALCTALLALSAAA